MSKEREEAIVIGGEIARFHVDGAQKRIALAKEIAAALLEARADGVDWCSDMCAMDPPTEYIARLRTEAQQLKEKT